MDGCSWSILSEAGLAPKHTPHRLYHSILSSVTLGAPFYVLFSFISSHFQRQINRREGFVVLNAESIFSAAFILLAKLFPLISERQTI